MAQSRATKVAVATAQTRALELLHDQSGEVRVERRELREQHAAVRRDGADVLAEHVLEHAHP